MALTPKQENFCRLIASGKDYTTAYLTAYDWNGNNSGAAVEAIRLMNREDIQEKIQSLMKPKEIAIQRDSINARQEQIDFIKSRIAACVEKEDENSLIRWNEQLNKIYALYKETDTEQKTDNMLDNIDSTILQRLSGVS